MTPPYTACSLTSRSGVLLLTRAYSLMPFRRLSPSMLRLPRPDFCRPAAPLPSPSLNADPAYADPAHAGQVVMPSRKIPSSTFFLVVVMLAVGLLGSGCAEEPTTPAYTVRPVRVAVAEGSKSGATRVVSGQTRSPADSRLSFRVSGIIVRMEVGVGEPLKADQLVAALDPQDYQIEVREAEAMLLMAEAEERNAAAWRTRALYAAERL